MSNVRIVLVAGFPRAGKSSFADAVEQSDLGLTHVPMDRYIRPLPAGIDFLDWVREPSCVEWELIREHLQLLTAGRVCFTPRPDWEERGRWRCSGGAVESGLGRKMVPARNGYLLAGTHVFSFAPTAERPVKVWMESPEIVVASRLAGRPVDDADKDRIIREHLGGNLAVLRKLRGEADLLIAGTAPRETQVQTLRDDLARTAPER
jgi:hypothetical protein